ncbi:hypothetical protein BJX66DRAFT_137918 [Aspergillus keveii]|uniref:Uncharacterized protein n=1 Tax=Aspergillus keveii TaxID=714993 RepID=A0ABR4GBX4_9EURO
MPGSPFPPAKSNRPILQVSFKSVSCPSFTVVAFKVSRVRLIPAHMLGPAVCMYTLFVLKIAHKEIAPPDLGPTTRQKTAAGLHGLSVLIGPMALPASWALLDLDR